MPAPISTWSATPDTRRTSLVIGYGINRRCSLEAAVWRLSGQLADVFRLTDRGFIRTGLAADLVAFDPATVTNLPNERVWDFPADTDRLISHNRGIEDVWVAGRLIQKHGVPVSGARPGALVSA